MLKKVLLVLLSLACCSPFGWQQAAALEIIYPADGTYVVRNDYIIFQGGEPAIDAFALEIDGVKSQLLDISSPQYRQVMRDMVVLPAGDPASPLFAEEGKHKVVIEGYVRGQKEWEKVRVVEAEFFYAPDPTTPPPAGFEPFLMHVPQREALCAGCHDMDTDRVAMDLADPTANPCVRCHKRMLSRGHVHGPAGAFQCGSCHQQSVGGVKYAIEGGGSGICNGCHEDKKAEFESNKYVHGPVGAGLCLVCHDAHASDLAAQLLMPINKLCLECHEKLDKGSHVVRGVGGKGHPLEGVANPADPSRDISCASCHNPHGGAGPNLFINGLTGRFSLCQHCHQK